MVQKLKLRSSVGRLRGGSDISPFEAAYIPKMKASMQNVLKNLQQFIDWVPDATADILEESLQPTFQKSQEYVPVDTGDLKNSGFLQKDSTKSSARVVIGYGRAGNPNYAAFVHERIDIPHEAPTRARFLSSALEEDQGDIQGRIIRALKQASGV